MNPFLLLAILLPFTSKILALPALKLPALYDLPILNKRAASLSKREIGGVTLSDGINFTGHVWYGVYPVDTCVALNDYAGKVLSFRPDQGTECFLMQGRCDDNEPYADLQYDSAEDGDLSIYSWINDTRSYFCEGIE